jgi:hypothetical protein
MTGTVEQLTDEFRRLLYKGLDTLFDPGDEERKEMLREDLDRFQTKAAASDPVRQPPWMTKTELSPERLDKLKSLSRDGLGWEEHFMVLALQDALGGRYALEQVHEILGRYLSARDSTHTHSNKVDDA